MKYLSLDLDTTASLKVGSGSNSADYLSGIAQGVSASASASVFGLVCLVAGNLGSARDCVTAITSAEYSALSSDADSRRCSTSSVCDLKTNALHEP